MRDRPTPLSRRSMLAGSLAGLAVAAAGCDALDGVLGGDDDPAGAGGSTPTEPAADDDSAIVDEAGTAIAEAEAVARASAAGAPALAPMANRFARLHQFHLDRLGWTGDQPKASPDARAKGVVRRQLLQSEAELQATLAAAAGRAESGALAQVLASMAAAVAQQRAVAA